jgi:hypothetical protein
MGSGAIASEQYSCKSRTAPTPKWVRLFGRHNSSGGGLVAAMLASRDFKGIRRKRLPIFMLGADHAFQDPMGRWIATGTLAE